MEYHIIIQTIEEVAKKYFLCCDVNLWDPHTKFVREFAAKLAEIEGVDMLVVEIADLLHDTGKYKVIKTIIFEALKSQKGCCNHCQLLWIERS